MSKPQAQKSDEPSELWIRKMKNIFRCLDANHNNVLEKADFEEMVQRFTKYGELTDEQVKRFNAKMGAWWEQNFNEGVEEVSFEKFWKGRYKMSKASSPGALENFKGILELMFDAIDTDSSGFISLDEWKVYHLAMGIDDEEATKQVFATVDLNHDEKMSLDEFTKGFFDFLCNQEDSVYKNLLGSV